MPQVNAKAKKAHVFEREEHDWYIEPRWITDALLGVERFEGQILDPCCGSGNIVRAAREHGYDVIGNDIVRRSEYCDRVVDFLEEDEMVDNIIANPPFKLCNKAPYPFVEHALRRARYKVAFVMHRSWLFGDRRGVWLGGKPLYQVHMIAPRPSMPSGHLIMDGGKIGGGTIDFVWCVFLRGYNGAPQMNFLNRHKHVPERFRGKDQYNLSGVIDKIGDIGAVEHVE